MKTELKWYVCLWRGALPKSNRRNALAKPGRNLQKVNYHGHILVRTRRGKNEAASDYIIIK